MNKKEIAYELALRSKLDINSFLHEEFIIPCILRGFDSFIEEELENFMLRSKRGNYDYQIIAPSVMNVMIDVNTNKSIEEVKADLISCDNQLHTLLTKFELDYRQISNTSYVRCVGEPEVSITDFYDCENEIIYNY